MGEVALFRQEYITNRYFFEVMRVLIVTDIFRRLEQEILLLLVAGGYRVWIKEMVL